MIVLVFYWRKEMNATINQTRCSMPNIKTLHEKAKVQTSFDHIYISMSVLLEEEMNDIINDKV